MLGNDTDKEEDDMPWEQIGESFDKQLTESQISMNIYSLSVSKIDQVSIDYIQSLDEESLNELKNYRRKNDKPELLASLANIKKLSFWNPEAVKTSSEAADKDLNSRGHPKKIAKVHRFNQISSAIENLRLPPNDEIEILYKSNSDGKEAEVVDKAFKKFISDFVLEQQKAREYFLEFPPDFLLKVTEFLDSKTLINSRLVSKSWNKLIETSEALLQNHVLILGSSLELVKICNATQVQWQNVKCSLLPGCDFKTTIGYQQNYFANKLTLTAKSFLVSSITTIMLDHFEIPKEHLIKWLNSCVNLKALELIGCTFNKKKASWTTETLKKVSDKLKEIKLKEMSLASMADFGRMILINTKKLKTFHLSQSGIDPSIYSHKENINNESLRAKSLEEELAAVLILTMERNVKSLKSLKFTFEVFQTISVYSKIFERIGSNGMDLEELGFEVRKSKSKDVILDPRLLGIEEGWPIRNILMSSPSLKKLHIPFLKLDWSDFEDVVWDFPLALNDIEIQLKTQRQNNKIVDGLSERYTFKRMVLHGNIFRGDELLDFKKCVPRLDKLELYSGEILDSDLQGIIENFENLTVLTLDGVKGLSDCGLTGLDIGELDKLRRLWNTTEAIVTEGLPKTGLDCVGKSLREMKYLQRFKIRGNFAITDIGISYGFGHKGLEVLEFSGSILDISQNGLHYLGNNCCNLASLAFQLAQDDAAMNPTVVQDLLTSKLPFLTSKKTKIQYL